MTSSAKSEVISEPFEIGICTQCGKPLMARKISFGNITVPIACECEIKQREEAAKLKKSEYLKEQREKLLATSGIPPLLRTHTFDNFYNRNDSTKTALKISREYAENFAGMKKGLIFIGNTGSGKTHLASAIGNALIEQSVSVKYIRVCDLYYKIRATFNSTLVSEADVIDPLRKAKLLILDDLGTEAPTEWSKSILQSLIDCRINYCLPMIITTNLTVEEMERSIDARTVDRIFDDRTESGCFIVPIKAPTFRRK